MRYLATLLCRRRDVANLHVGELSQARVSVDNCDTHGDIRQRWVEPKQKRRIRVRLVALSFISDFVDEVRKACCYIVLVVIGSRLSVRQVFRKAVVNLAWS